MIGERGARRNVARITGMLLLAACAAFWLWFGIASALSEGLDVAGAVLHALVPGGALLLLLLLAWRLPRLAGVLLVLAGLAVFVGYPWMVGGRFPLTTILFVLAVLGLPPLAAGVLLLSAARGRARD